jgi:hypothetical protein
MESVADWICPPSKHPQHTIPLSFLLPPSSFLSPLSPLPSPLPIFEQKLIRSQIDHQTPKIPHILLPTISTTVNLTIASGQPTPPSPAWLPDW